MASVEQTFARAVTAVRDGKLAEAERQFKRVLRDQPKHVAALNLLAVVLTQLKRYPEAERYIKSAIAINASSDVTFYNYGLILRAMDRPLEALECFGRALAINASVPETWNNSGIVLNGLGRYDDALIKFDRAIAIKPDYVEAFYNKGKSLFKLGRLDAASGALDRALALRPDLAEGWLALGDLLAKLERQGEARAAYLRAHALNPDMLEAAGQRVFWLMSEGNVGEALKLARRALAERETFETKSLVAFCLRSSNLHVGADDPRDLLVRAISEPWIRPKELASACASFLVLNDEIRDCMERAAKVWPQLLPVEDLANPSRLAKLANDRLLLATLEAAPVYGSSLEQFVTGLRFALLSAARSATNGPVTEPVLRLYCAIAHQCYINNYVFAQNPAETEQLDALAASISAALASGDAIPILALLATASYVPLHHLPEAASLLRRIWPDAVAEVLARQVRAPLEEQRLRASMPALTTIDDDVSIKVRDQYEENPYPQWAKAAPAGDPAAINGYMRERFPKSRFAAVDDAGELSVLVAGCGTGQHSLDAARRFKGARVLAVDISLTSLGYAKRQADALGVSNLDYAQADIMKLGSIGRAFDVIETVGVLHHLADPFAGWRVLLSMLRPGGIMRVGLYSEIARRDVMAAREHIAKRGYQSTADGIRRCRQELLVSTESALKNITSISDFFSLSECRDLLFNVQETRHTLPDISAFIAENDLRLIGFEADPLTFRKYAEKFPDDIAMTNLAHWHQYEIDNPFTFISMYDFWVQKAR
jgi:tetratricopeptide (TPR) repeat protein/2-polyprenyl-3-methyl-5-hydroxy-6-metoxy-1,4-benzoquinol methylase